MARNNQRGSNNNNPQGRNQYSNGFMDMARERPAATAAAAAGAVAAGVFLWSKRSQISDQISSLSEQIGEWNENRQFGGSNREFETVGGADEFQPTTSRAARASRTSDMAGGGRKGAASGGAGISGNGGRTRTS